MSPSDTSAQSAERFTYCRLCEALCGLVATVECGRIASIAPDRNHLHSRGHVCVKGVSAHAITHDPDRVLKPLKRVGGPGEFVEVEWGEALDDIAARLMQIIEQDGPESFGLYLGNPPSHSSLNMAYAAGFPAALGSPKLYSASSQDASSRVAANELLYNSSMPFLIPDLLATDVLLIFGANPVVSKGSLICAPRMAEDLKEVEKRGGRVIVFDPRRTETAKSHQHVFIRPGMDAWAILGIIKILRSEALIDDAFIERHTTGYDRLVQYLDRVDIPEIVQLTGVSGEVLTDVALAFGRAERAAVYSRVGICRGRFSTLTNALVDMLAIVTGNFARKGGIGFGLNLTKAGRGHAISETVAPRTRIGNLPAPGGHMPSGVMAADILQEGEGRIKALMTVGGNPVLSSPNGTELLQAFGKLDLMVSLDIYRTETSRHAHYILPTPTFLERDDIAINNVPFMVRPHLLGTRRVIEPLGDVREEHEIFWELSDRLNLPTPLPMIRMATSPDGTARERHEEILGAIVRSSSVGDEFGKNPNGLTLEALLDRYPHGKELEQSDFIEHWRGTAYEDRRIHLCDEALADEFERLLAMRSQGSADLKLIGRRNLRSMNSWMHNAERLIRSQRPTLMMHPADAAFRGLVDGANVAVSSKTATISAILEITDEVMPGVVSYPHGFGHEGGGWTRANDAPGANVNLLASSEVADLEQVSGASFLDGIPVQVDLLLPTNPAMGA